MSTSLNMSEFEAFYSYECRERNKSFRSSARVRFCSDRSIGMSKLKFGKIRPTSWFIEASMLRLFAFNFQAPRLDLFCSKSL